jgi:hypothetical protein
MSIINEALHQPSISCFLPNILHNVTTKETVSFIRFCLFTMWELVITLDPSLNEPASYMQTSPQCTPQEQFYFMQDAQFPELFLVAFYLKMIILYNYLCE